MICQKESSKFRPLEEIFPVILWLGHRKHFCSISWLITFRCNKLSFHRNFTLRQKSLRVDWIKRSIFYMLPLRHDWWLFIKPLSLQGPTRLQAWHKRLLIIILNERIFTPELIRTFNAWQLPHIRHIIYRILIQRISRINSVKFLKLSLLTNFDS